ncbi:hypothetical protein [Mesorhizobium sp. 1M-11]|uniref:hypothetical protein n=1 Tax=Mesorhizobium sp. 1M-11 TaxID=1529006 RepID=UPI0006C76628|nr:hypothetical protein [Mesorhizobium sp. 1M-11]
MLAFLNSKIGVHAICGLIGAAFIGWTYYEVYQSGRAYERSAVLEATVKALRDRANENAAVEALDPLALCIELGGLPDECTAELQRLGVDLGQTGNGGLPRR